MTSRSILLVEDNPTARKLFKISLELEGYRVVATADAESALAHAIVALPDLVILDMVLPDMTGTELLAQLRALAGGETLPIVAVTGLPARAVEARTSAGRFDSVLQKPVDSRELVACVRHHLEGSPSRCYESKRILVVDDDPIERKLLGVQLRDLGFEVTTLADSRNALETAHEQHPDLIVSDVMMPEVDGFELCHRVRSDSGLAQVPIVLMTAHYVEDADRALATHVGASAYVTRTPTTDHAIQAVLRCLGQTSARPTTVDVEIVPSVDVEIEHAAAVRRQLDRQHRHNRELCAAEQLHETTMTMLQTLARILDRDLPLSRALEDVLYTVTEMTGVDATALYHLDSAGWNRIASIESDHVDLSRTHSALLARCISPEEPLRLETDAEGQDVLDMIGARSGALVPIVARDRRIGALLLTARDADVSDQTLALTRVVTLHLGLALALHGSRDELARSREQYRFLMQAATDVVVILDGDGKVIDINDHACDVMGGPRELFVGHHMYEFAVSGTEALMELGLHAPTERRETAVIRTLAGEARYFDSVRIPMAIDGRPHFMIIAHDVTARREMEEQLRSSEERYRSLVVSIPDVVWYGTATRTYDVTDNADTILGFTASEILADHDLWFARIHDEDRDKVRTTYQRFVERLQPLDIEYRYEHRNGSWLWLHARGVRTYEKHGLMKGCAVVTDTTQRKKFESQMQHAQRMEAVGMLSGGVAHDFNNILSVVLANADFLGESLSAQDVRRADVSEIRRAAERGANLTRQLLAFSRRQVLAPTVLDLNVLIKDLQKMLVRLIGEDIQLTVVPGVNLGSLRADAGQLEQVIVNLVVNARDAIGTNGHITIETTNVDVDSELAAVHAPLVPGPHVMFSVTDDGCGMDAETQQRIFEPFFSTKQERGTGLGLSTTYGIVKQSGGCISVYSEPDRGTTFRVFLPRTTAPTEERARRVSEGHLYRGSETILVLEDDAGVRAGVSRILTSRGYKVLAAGTTAEAMKLVAMQDGPIHLVLSDVVMPGGSGVEAVEALRAHSMSLRVLFMSGYTDHTVFLTGELPTGMNFIQKPFSAAALTKRVREVLDA